MNTATLPIRSISSVFRTGLMAAAVATIGNSIIYFAGSFFNLSFVVPTPSEPFSITLANVIVETLLLSAGATLVFALLCRLTPHAIQIFRVIAVIVLLLSFIFPLLLPVEPPLKIILLLMHILSASVIVTLLTRSPEIKTHAL